MAERTAMGTQARYAFPAGAYPLGLDLDRRPIHALAVRVDFVKLTGEGRLQISLTGDTLAPEDLEKVRDLLQLIRGRVLVDFTAQGELPQ